MALPGQFVARDRAGLACISDEWVTCQPVDPEDLEEWRIGKAPGRDPRLLPDARALRGKEHVRLLPFADAMRPFARRDLAGWPFRGPVAAKEFCLGLVVLGTDLVQHDRAWRHRSGLTEHSGTARLHRYLLESLHQFVTDQLDVTNSAGCEYLFRAVIAAETAMRLHSGRRRIGVHAMGRRSRAR